MIPGLSYSPNALTEEQEQALLEELDTLHWQPLTDSPNSRRVQHYGYAYDYKRRMVSAPTVAIPDGWTDLFHHDPLSQWNQVIVNEYHPGQGISAHIDSLHYGEVIQCYTLGSGATMRFTCTTTGERRDLYVEPRSVYVMAGESRYQWKHEMIGRKSDVVEGARRERGKRISVTLRSVPLTSDDS